MIRVAASLCLLLAACDGCTPAADVPPPPPARPSTQAAADELARLSAAADKLKPEGPKEHDVAAWRAYADALAGVRRIDEAVKAYDRCTFEGEATMKSVGEAHVGEEVVDTAMYCAAAAALGRQLSKPRDGGTRADRP